MPVAFEWYIGEEEIVNEIPAPRKPTAAVQAVSPTVFVVVVILLLSGALAILQIREELAVVEEETAAEALDSYRLTWLAEERDDSELLPLAEAEQPSSWAKIQKQVFNLDMLVNRAPLGLYAQEGTPQLVETRLSPDLQEAVIVTQQWYDTRVGKEVTETVVLEHTAVLRRSETRWLLVQPDQRFWGDRDTIEGEMFTFTYPQRDAAIAEKFAQELDLRLAELCDKLLDIYCPPDMTITVTWDTDPASLAALAHTDVVYRGQVLVLPTPTLVGIPVDEKGVQALFYGYVAHVATAVISDLIGWECRNPLNFYTQLRTGHLTCVTK